MKVSPVKVIGLKEDFQSGDMLERKKNPADKGLDWCLLSVPLVDYALLFYFEGKKRKHEYQGPLVFLLNINGLPLQWNTAQDKCFFFFFFFFHTKIPAHLPSLFPARHRVWAGGGWGCFGCVMLGWTWYRISWGLYL